MEIYWKATFVKCEGKDRGKFDNQSAYFNSTLRKLNGYRLVTYEWGTLRNLDDNVKEASSRYSNLQMLEFLIPDSLEP